MKRLLFLLLLLALASSNAEARERAQRAAFKKEQPCPSTGRKTGACPGWVIDHINPLACGGADHPSNMQWQTKADAKSKDRWERKACQAWSP